MNQPAKLLILRSVLGVVVGGYGLLLVVSQLAGRRHHALILLGLAELVGAILLLIPRTVFVGGVTLLLVFGLAALFHVLHREYDVGFLAVYAAATYAVISRSPRA